MKSFNLFLLEEREEPFYQVKEIEPKETPLGAFTRIGGFEYLGGNKRISKLGVTIPGLQDDTNPDLKYLHVKIGKYKTHGWGQEFKSLEEAGLTKRNINSQKEHINKINTRLQMIGEPPASIQHISILYAPHKSFIHLKNKKDFEIGTGTYQPAGIQSGQRYYYGKEGRGKWYDLDKMLPRTPSDNEMLSFYVSHPEYIKSNYEDIYDLSHHENKHIKSIAKALFSTHFPDREDCLY